LYFLSVTISFTDYVKRLGQATIAVTVQVAFCQYHTQKHVEVMANYVIIPRFHRTCQQLGINNSREQADVDGHGLGARALAHLGASYWFRR
jgi:hypothetical protein